MDNWCFLSNENIVLDILLETLIGFYKIRESFDSKVFKYLIL